MKKETWDGSVEESKEFIEATAAFPEEAPAVKVNALSVKPGITELRWRIEERLEFNYEELDDISDEIN